MIQPDPTAKTPNPARDLREETPSQLRAEYRPVSVRFKDATTCPAFMSKRNLSFSSL